MISDAPTPILEVRNITLERGDRRILDRVSFDITAGELVALVGPNGAGKTSLLNVITRDITPTSGHIRIAGTDLDTWTHRQLARRRAVMAQSTSIEFDFTVDEIVAMGRDPWHRLSTADTDHELITAALAATDMGSFTDRLVTTLSGGEAARVHLARALAQHTPLLFLDEPTAALDLRHRERVMALTAALAQLGTSIIMVQHDLAVAATWADRVIVLHDGRIAADGPPPTVLTAELIARVYDVNVRVTHHDHTITVTPERHPTNPPNALTPRPIDDPSIDRPTPP